MSSIKIILLCSNQMFPYTKALPVAQTIQEDRILLITELLMLNILKIHVSCQLVNACVSEVCGASVFRVR